MELQRYDEVSETWLALTVLGRDLENNSITVSLDHFTAFALLVEAADTNQQLYLPLVIR